MSIFLITLLLVVAILALMMLGLGIKMLLTHRGEFKRHCSSIDPYTGDHAGCVCGRAAQSQCEKKKHYSPLEVNENLMDEVKGGQRQ